MRFKILKFIACFTLIGLILYPIKVDADSFKTSSYSWLNMRTWPTVGSGYNTRGGFVSALQANLKSSGESVAVGSVDGQFGPKTNQGVRNFQSYYGLSVDGIAGRQTWGKMNDYYNYVTASRRDYVNPRTSLYHVRYTKSITNDIHGRMYDWRDGYATGPFWLFRTTNSLTEDNITQNNKEEIKVISLEEAFETSDFKLPEVKGDYTKSNENTNYSDNIKVFKSVEENGDIVTELNYQLLSEDNPADSIKGLLHYYQVKLETSKDQIIEEIENEFGSAESLNVNNNPALLIQRTGTDLLYVFTEDYQYIFVTDTLNKEEILEIGNSINY